MSSIVSLTNVNKEYQLNKHVVKAVHQASFEISKGELVAIVGPSGSGKSTLLNLIGCLDTPTQGSIFIDGCNTHTLESNDLADFRRDHIGFVFQAYNLIPVLTVAENIEYVLVLQKKPQKEREKKVKDILTKLDLIDKINCRPFELSGGQQQRVAVARALVSEPTMILADEPTANLDSKTAKDLIDLMKKINEEQQATFILSTHDPMVQEQAKRVLTIKDGSITHDISK